MIKLLISILWGTQKKKIKFEFAPFSDKVGNLSINKRDSTLSPKNKFYAMNRYRLYSTPSSISGDGSFTIQLPNGVKRILSRDFIE